MMDERGITLIELLVVIAIIGILAMIAIPGYVGQQKNAERTEAYTNLQNLRLLEEQHFADQGSYTVSLGTPGKDNNGNVSDIQQGVPAGGGPAQASQALPGFRPGNGPAFSYWIVNGVSFPINTAANPATGTASAACFVAFACGNSTSRTNGEVFAIDCNNNRNF